MSESQNPAQGFLGNLKDKAQELAANVGNVVEGAADRVIGEEKVDKIKDVLNTDVKELAQDAQGAVKDKTEDLLEGAENLADRVIGEERVDKLQSFLQQDVKQVMSNLKEKAEDVLDKKTED